MTENDPATDVKKKAYGEDITPQRETHKAIVISNYGAELCKKLESSSKDIYIDHLIHFSHEKSLSSVAATSPSDNLLIAFDIQNQSFVEEDLKEKSVQIEGFKMRSANRIPIISFGPQISARQHRDLLLKAGFDFYIPSDCVTQATLQMYSIFEKSQFSKNERKYHFSGKHERNLKLGNWTIILENQTIKTPDNTEVSITKLEWEYLFFLFDRDIRNSEIPDVTSGRYEEQVNSRAIVYKLKKKLGSDFPIFKKKSGPYYIDPSKT